MQEEEKQTEQDRKRPPKQIILADPQLLPPPRHQRQPVPPPPLDLGAEALQEGDQEAVLEIVAVGVVSADKVQLQRDKEIVQLQSQPSQLEAGAVVAEAVEGHLIKGVVQGDGVVVEKELEEE